MIFGGLIIISDYYNKKTCILSLRSAAFFFILGMNFIVTFLGLLSIWMIIYFPLVQGTHIWLFIRSLKLENDPSFKYWTLGNAAARRGVSVMQDTELASVNRNNQGGGS